MNFSEEVKTTLWDLIDEMSQNKSSYVVHPSKDFSRNKEVEFSYSDEIYYFYGKSVPEK